ncbi:MAG: type II toxin-antitoxin system VapC family toxin [Acidobacteriota bacterium]
MRQKVYIETSVVSYLTARPSKNAYIAGHQDATKDWWDKRRAKFDLFTSQLTIREASAGDKQMAEQRLRILTTLSLVDVTQEAIDLSQRLFNNGPLPPKAADDALHIALAAVHGIDYLLTWNCKHMANAEMQKTIVRLCNDNGFNAPVICTPEQLMGV